MKTKLDINKSLNIVANATKYTFASLLGCTILNAKLSLAGTPISSTPVFDYSGNAIGYTVDAVSLSDAFNNQTSCTKTSTRDFNITLPPNATVKEAHLYWATENTLGDSQVTLNGQTVTATQSWNDSIVDLSFNGYRSEVGFIVSDSGTYTFGGLTSRDNVPYQGACLAGATLIVVYETTVSDPNAVNRIQIFDGFEGIRGSGLTATTESSVNLDLNLKEVDLTLMTALSWQGNSLDESDSYSDLLEANGQTVSNNNNPQDDQGNSSGADKAPNSVYAVDADTFDISFVKGASSLNLTNTSIADDYKIVQGFVFASRGSDLSDAPISYGLANHSIAPSQGAPSLTFGSVVDGEVVDNDYAGSVNADDDDNNNPINDEDGINVIPALNTINNSYSLTVTVNNSTGSAANVYGWIDFDRDGEFDEDERATVVSTNSSGTVTLNWDNIGSTNGADITSGNSYLRIRTATQNLDLNTNETSNQDDASIIAADNGEVEDYKIAIANSNISGTVFEDINYGGGAGRNFTTAEASATSSGFANKGTNATGVNNARVELYSTTTGFIAATTTDADGNYSFSDLAKGDYQVRVVNNSVTSNRSRNSTNETPFAVQTFRNDADETNSEIVNEVGGVNPAVIDAAEVTTVGTSLPANAQSVTGITVSDAVVSNVDFGFNFDTVVNTNDSGQGSLRQFIVNSNELANTNLSQDLPAAITAPADKNDNPVNLDDYETSIFMIPDNFSTTAPDGGTGSAFTIDLTSELVDIDDEYTAIDGRTQTVNITTVSNEADTNVNLSGGSESTGSEVIINSQATNDQSPTVLETRSSNTIIHSVGITGELTGAQWGLRTSSEGNTVGNNTILSNIIVDSVTIYDVTACGVFLVTTHNSVIRNSVVRDTGDNVGQLCDNFQLRSNSRNNLIENNLILRAGHYGIDIVSTNGLDNPGNIVRGNIIAGNGTVGTSNQNSGIGLRTSTSAEIVDNTIYSNVGDGITVTRVGITSTSNKISQNSIYNNGDLGIDLGAGASGDGVTNNDNGDGDTSINQLQNFPTINRVSVNGTNYVVEGTLNSTPSNNFDIEIYSNAVCNPDRDGNTQAEKYGEGEKYHSTTTVSTDGTGVAAFSTTIAINEAAGSVFTATATDNTSNNTSEFSQCETISVPIYDYGDAPDENLGTGTGNYQTTTDDNGAAQIVLDVANQVLSLGNAIDADSGNLQNENADADDLDGDDEDGVDIDSLPTLTTQANQTYTILVTVRNNVPLTNAYLVGFIDFNKNGKFDDGEQSNTVTIEPDANGDPRKVNVTFTTPSGLTSGNTYARFRLGQVKETAEQATGASENSAVTVDNGEIEDYKIAIGSIDYGDAPTSYTTARIEIDSNVYLGSTAPDPDTGNWHDGTDDSENATDDDTNDDPTKIVATNDEEDSVVFTSLNLSMAGSTFNKDVTVNNNSDNSAYVRAWIDFDRNGTFDDDEVSDEATVAGNAGDTTANLSFSVPNNISPGPSFARVVVSDTPNIPKLGQGTGEIEDHIINIGDKDICNSASNTSFSAFDFTNVSGNIGQNLNLTSAVATYKNAVVDLEGIPLDVKTTVNATEGKINKFGNGAEDGRDAFEWYLAIGNTDNDALAKVTLEFFVAGTNIPRPVSGQFATGDIDGVSNRRTEALLLKTTDFSGFALNSPTTIATPPINLEINGEDYTVFQGTSNRNDDPDSFVTYTFDNKNNINFILRVTEVSGTRSAGFPINGRIASSAINNANCTTPTASVPELLLVKRITAINPGQSDERLFDTFNEDGIADNADNNSNWSDKNTFLPGATNVTGIKPGDEVEYTIYFLSSGDKPATSVQICYVIPNDMTFMKNTYGIETGIGLELTTANPPLTNSPNIKLSNVTGDETEDNLAQGAFFAPGTNLDTDPADLCKKPNPDDTTQTPALIDVNKDNNTSGAVWVKLNNPLPSATSAGTPANSYGFIRFRTKVK